jgi:hypothetical protein
MSETPWSLPYTLTGYKGIHEIARLPVLTSEGRPEAQPSALVIDLHDRAIVCRQGIADQL